MDWGYYTSDTQQHWLTLPQVIFPDIIPMVGGSSLMKYTQISFTGSLMSSLPINGL